MKNQRIFKPDSLPTVTAGNASSRLTVKFSAKNLNTSIYIAAIMCSTRDGADASMSGMRVKIEAQDNSSLVTDGEAPTYIPLSELCPKFAPWFRFKEPVEMGPDQKWFVTFQNDTAGSLVPSISFLAFEAKPGGWRGG